MAQITKRGRDLAWSINPWIGTTTEIEETCSLIARHAKTYSGIQEVWCCVDLSDRPREQKRLEDREAALEARITDLVAQLPQPDDGRWTVKFDGDPRAWTVRLIAPDGRERGCDNP